MRVNGEKGDRNKIKLTEEFVQRSWDEINCKKMPEASRRRSYFQVMELLEQDCLRGIWASKRISKFV